MAYIDKQSVIDVIKKKKPQFASGLTDEQIYRWAADNLDPGKISGGKADAFRPWQDEKYAGLSLRPPPTPILKKEAPSEEEPAINPKTFMDSVSDLSIAGWIGDATDTNYLKYAATKGSWDMGRAIMSGESNYQLYDENGDIMSPEDYAKDLNFFQDSAAWVMGQLNPTDAALWVFTGGLGKSLQVGAQTTKVVAGAGAQKWGKDLFLKSVQRSAGRFRKGGSEWGEFAAKTVERMPSSAVSIGAFSTAAGMLNTAYQQRMSDKVDGIGVGELDAKEIAWAGVTQGVEGAILGSLTAPLHVGATTLTSKLAKGSDKWYGADSGMKKAIDNIGKASIYSTGLGAEGALFGNLPYLWRGVPLLDDTKELGWDNVDWHQVGHDWGHATSTVGLIKGSIHSYGKMSEYLRGETKSEGDALANNSGDNKKKSNIINSINNSGKNIDPAQVKRLVKELNDVELKEMGIDLDGYTGKQAILKILDSPESINVINKIKNNESLTKEEMFHLKELESAQRIANEYYRQMTDTFEFKTDKNDKKTDVSDWSTSESFTKFVDTVVKKAWLKKNKGKKDWTEAERKAEGMLIAKEMWGATRRADKINNSINDITKAGKDIKIEFHILEQQLGELRKNVEKIKDVEKREKLLKEIDKAENKAPDGFNKDFDTVYEGDPSQGKIVVEKLKTKIDKIKSEFEAPGIKDQIKTVIGDITSFYTAKGVKTPEINKIIKQETVPGDDVATARNLQRRLKKLEEGDVGKSQLDKDLAGKDTDGKSWVGKGKNKKTLSLKTKGGQERKNSDGLTSDTIVENSSLNTKNKSIVKMALERFMSEGSGLKPVEKIVQFFEFLQKKKISLDNIDASDWTNFKKSINLDKNSKLRIEYQDAFAQFFGGRREGARNRGYSDFYLDGRKIEQTKRDADVDLASQKRAVVTNKEGNKLLKGISKATESIKKVTSDTYNAIIQLQYKLGRRGEEILSDTRVEHIDIKAGTVSLGSGKLKIRHTLPLKEMDPVLWDTLVKLTKGKKPGDLLFQKEGGGKISTSHYNSVLKEVFQKYGINVEGFGGKEKLTQSDFRKIVETAATDTKNPAMTLLMKYLAGRKVGVQEGYTTKDWVELYQEFQKTRGIDVTKTTTQKTLTPEQENYFIIQRLEKKLERLQKQARKFPYFSKEKNKLIEEMNGVRLEISELKKPSTQEKQTLPPGSKLGKPESPTERARVEKIEAKYKDIVKEVKRNQKELKDEDGKPLGKDVVETVSDGVVRVRSGASVEAALHGMGHPVYKFLKSIQKASPNSKLGKTALGLVRRMQKTVLMNKKGRDRVAEWTKKYMKEDGMRRKAARERAIEETWMEMTGEYIAGRVMDKTMFNRIKDWMHRTYAVLKTKFKSVDKLTQEEVVMLYGEAFLKRKGIPIMTHEHPVGKNRMEFMTATKGDRDKSINLIRVAAADIISSSKKLKGETVDSFIEYIAKEANIRPRGDEFKLSDMTEGDLINLSLTMKSIDVSKKKPIDIVKERFKLELDIDKNRANTDILEKDQADYLKISNSEHGINSGKIVDTPIEVLREWNSVLVDRKINRGTFDEFIAKTEAFLESPEGNTKLGKVLAGGKIQTLKHIAAKNLLGLAKFAKSIGLDNLSKWTYDHITAEQFHVGPFIEFFQERGGAARILGEKGWAKVKGTFALVEAAENGSFIRINDKSANPKEVSKMKSFIEKGFHVEKKKNKAGEEKWYNRGIKWDRNLTDAQNFAKGNTKEGQLLSYFKHDLIQELQIAFERIAGSKFTEARFEKFLKQNNIKFLGQSKNGFYIPRRMTKDFGVNFEVKSKKYASEIQRVAMEDAIELAKNKYGDKYKKATTAEKTAMANEFVEASTIKARWDLHNTMSFGSTKIKLGNLVARNRFKLPETYKIKDKEYKVWETDIEAIVLPFASGWAKLLSNMEHAPWAVGLKGYAGSKDMIEIIKDASTALGLKGSKGNAIKTILQEGIEQRVGTYSNSIHNPGYYSVSRDYTATLMRLQLSGPLPFTGIKNHFTQAIQMLHIGKFFDVAHTWFKAFDAKERQITEKKGAGGVTGLGGYKPTSEILTRSTKWWFRSGLMPFTEIVGKTWARLYSNLDVKNQSEVLQTSVEGSKAYKYAETRLKEIYEMTDSQIQLIKEYGFDPKPENMSKRDAEIITNEVEMIINKAEMAGNIKTAGSTIDSMMPSTFNVKGFKPFLMYKRIAYSTTINNGEIMNYNRKNGHIMRSAMMIGGTYLSGAVRIGLLKGLLGQTLPAENSDWWKAFKVTMWQGEAFGILSELFNPYKSSWFGLDGNLLYDSAIGSHIKRSVALAYDITGNFTGGWNASDTSMNSFNNWARATSSSYNQGFKIMNQKMNPYAKDYNAVKSWKKDFEDKHGYFADPDFEESESTKYFKHIRIAFNHGNMEELNEAVILGLYAKASDFMATGYTYDESMKLAYSKLKQRLKTLDPAMGSLEINRGVITPTQGFWESLDKEKQEVFLRARKEYNNKLLGFSKQFKYYLRKQNLKDIASQFKWELNPNLSKSQEKRIQRLRK